MLLKSKHGHPDHELGVVETMNAWPEASLYMHPMEEENYRRLREMIRLPDTPPPVPTHDLRDGDAISIGDNIELSVVHTPGHAPGTNSMSHLLIGDAGMRIERTIVTRITNPVAF
mmetsp:Transcript_14723/g.16881  ORF Transcript_14723/g.16881 Transcript_14723/m.16881 type:complete len:115 (-) Transcript_14723:41-385(-)